MRKDLTVLFMSFLVLLIQISVLPVTFLANSGLSLPVIYLVALTAYFPFRTVLINTFIICIVQDNFAAGMYGFHIFVTLVLIYLTIRARENMHSEELYNPALFTGLFLLAYEIIFICWSAYLGYSVFSWLSVIWKGIIGILLSMLLAYPADSLCQKFYNMLNFE